MVFFVLFPFEAASSHLLSTLSFNTSIALSGDSLILIIVLTLTCRYYKLYPFFSSGRHQMLEMRTPQLRDHFQLYDKLSIRQKWSKLMIWRDRFRCCGLIRFLVKCVITVDLWECYPGLMSVLFYLYFGSQAIVISMSGSTQAKLSRELVSIQDDAQLRTDLSCLL